MGRIQIVKFSEALKPFKSFNGKKHLLLGNGFSVACKKDVFNYEALYKSADFSNLSGKVAELFASLNTTDFEEVMKALNVSSKIIKLYHKDGDKISKQQKNDAKK